MSYRLQEAEVRLTQYYQIQEEVLLVQMQEDIQDPEVDRLDPFQ